MDRDPIAKTLRALRWLVEMPSMTTGVREFAAALNLPPSGAHRLLSRLVIEGMARQDGDGRYTLGVELYRIANLAAAKAPIRQAALAPMRQLVDACNETALLGIYDSDRQEMTFVATIESTHELRIVTPLNRWMPLHSGASGLAILAFLDHVEAEMLLERTRSECVKATEVVKLEGDLAQVRQRGWASTGGRQTAGAAALAAPIFGTRGEVVGAVTLKIPDQRLDEGGEPALAAQLLRCTRTITATLSGERLLGRPNTALKAEISSEERL